VNVRNLCVDSMLAGILRERALPALRHSLAEVDRLRAGAGKKQSFFMPLTRCRSQRKPSTPSLQWEADVVKTVRMISA
jgi:hypothetical protein